MRPSTAVSIAFAVLLGLGGIGLGIFLIADHNLQSVKWHYWLAPLLMIGTSAALLQLTALYMSKVGRTELRSRPPVRD